MACDSLLKARLLQVVNRLVAGSLSKLVFHRQVVSTNCNKSANYDRLQQAGKIDN